MVEVQEHTIEELTSTIGISCVEWSETTQEEISIVSDFIDSLDGAEQQFIELNISDSASRSGDSFIQQNINTGGKIPSERTRGNKNGLLNRKRSKKNGRIRKLNEDNVYPVRIGSRKLLNQEHFANFNPKTKRKKTVSASREKTIQERKIKEELLDENYFEECELENEAGCSSVKLEYGSGVYIYESVEAYDSDLESKKYSKRQGHLTKGGLFRCYKCSAQFPSKCELVEHKKQHLKKNKPFMCPICGALYYRPYKYYCHLGGHNNIFSCRQCNRTFVRVAAYKKHMRQCHKINSPQICVVCGKCFSSADELDGHLVEKHPNEAEGLKAFFEQCQHCRYQFVTELSYLSHIKNAPYSCSQCNQSFPCNNKLGFHLSFKHKPQLCRICGKSFDAFDQYTYHMQYYHTDKKISCPYCDEKFRVRSRLLIHIDVNHTEGHNYKCNQCDYTAKNYASVNRHRRIAHMPKNETHKNVCPICNKSFLVLSRLKVHMKSHSNAKPYVCKLCGRGYKFEYLLKKHQRNPDLCFRVLFPNGTRLERKGKRRCDICCVDFASPDQLAYHMVETHHVKITGNAITLNDAAERSNDVTNIVESHPNPLNGITKSVKLEDIKSEVKGTEVIQFIQQEELQKQENFDHRFGNYQTLLDAKYIIPGRAMESQFISADRQIIMDDNRQIVMDDNRQIVMDYISPGIVQVVNLPYDAKDP